MRRNQLQRIVVEAVDDALDREGIALDDAHRRRLVRVFARIAGRLAIDEDTPYMQFVAIVAAEANAEFASRNPARLGVSDDPLEVN